VAKKIVNKNGKKETYFNKYTIGESNSCPECHRAFKDFDIKNLEEREVISCVKCGAKLSRK
jgi:hypothetical protein